MSKHTKTVTGQILQYVTYLQANPGNINQLIGSVNEKAVCF